jgi:hypothetical protein
MGQLVSTLLQDRYGRRSPGWRNPLVLVSLALLVALVLAFIGWVTILDRPRVTWEDVGFNVRSDADVQVTFDVGLHGGTTVAVCSVHALNELGTEVGRKDVVIDRPATGGPNPQRVRVSLTTSELATTGLVESCSKG